MIISFKYNNNNYTADLNSPIDISMPISSDSAVAWSRPPVNITPVIERDWIGDVNQGSAINFNNILFNPHAHGTHTECVGHISPSKESINKELLKFFFISQLITIMPKRKSQDCVITRSLLKEKITQTHNIDALIIRTLPNTKDKLSVNYSKKNPPYLLESATKYITELNIKHLLIDLPSVDREHDEGQLKSHKSFWGYPNNIRHGTTITELIYVPNDILDGHYLLNLQFAPFENDAAPSRPVLFKLAKK